MKHSAIFVFFWVKLCASNELKCGQSDGNVESVEFYCENYEGTLPENCSSSFLHWIETCDKSKVTQLKIFGCDESTVAKFLANFVNDLSFISHSGYEQRYPFYLKHQYIARVNASHKRLTKIVKNFFSDTPNAIKVDFPNNELETDVFNQILAEVKSVNQFTTESQNEIPSRDICKNLNELKDLRSSQEVADLMSCLPSSLKTLDLSNITLGKVDSTIFKRFSNLENLNLRNTQLTEFDFSWLNGQRNLKTIDISENNLKTVKNAPILEAFGQLYSLHIEGNQVKNAAELIQYLSPSIKYLHLSGNYVGPLNDTTFEKLTNLEHLYLNKTNISLINVSPFKPLTRLEELYIGHNSLATIDINSLPGEHLFELDLSGNDLTRLDHFTQSRFPNLEFIDISENLFRCDYLNTFIPQVELEFALTWIIGWTQKHGEHCLPAY